MTGKWSLFNSACTHWSGLQNQKLTDYFSILVSDRDIEWKFRIIRESDLFFTSVNIQRYFVVRASCVWFGFLISCHENNAANVFPDNRRQRPITASGDQTCYKKSINKQTWQVCCCDLVTPLLIVDSWEKFQCNFVMLNAVKWGFHCTLCPVQPS